MSERQIRKMLMLIARDFYWIQAKQQRFAADRPAHRRAREAMAEMAGFLIAWGGMVTKVDVGLATERYVVKDHRGIAIEEEHAFACRTQVAGEKQGDREKD